MAIHPEVPGMGINILVGGKVAPEFKAEQKIEGAEERPTSHPVHCCYVESKTGKVFQIQITFDDIFRENLKRETPESQQLSIVIVVDGQYWGWSVSDHEMRSVRKRTFHPSKLAVGGYFSGDFIFGAIETGRSAIPYCVELV